jgi:hypothetical protein
VYRNAVATEEAMQQCDEEPRNSTPDPGPLTILVLLLWLAMISPIVYFGWRIIGVVQ